MEVFNILLIQYIQYSYWNYIITQMLTLVQLWRAPCSPAEI